MIPLFFFVCSIYAENLDENFMLFCFDIGAKLLIDTGNRIYERNINKDNWKRIILDLWSFCVVFGFFDGVLYLN
jgi:hypothetical protein